jgi:hypothetical protein
MIFLRNTQRYRKHRYFSGISTKKEIASYPYGSGTGQAGYNILAWTCENFDLDS